MENYPKKDYIKQVHCNPYGGKCLADYLCVDMTDSFITNGDTFSFEVRDYIEGLKWQ